MLVLDEDMGQNYNGEDTEICENPKTRLQTDVLAKLIGANQLMSRFELWAVCSL